MAQRHFPKYLHILILTLLLGGYHSLLQANEALKNANPVEMAQDLPTLALKEVLEKEAKYYVYVKFQHRKERGLDNIKPGKATLSFHLSDGTLYPITFTPKANGEYEPYPAEVLLKLKESVKGYQIKIENDLNVYYASGKKIDQPAMSVEYESSNAVFIKAGEPREIYLVYTGETHVLMTMNLEFVKHEAGGGTFNITFTPRSYVDVFHTL